MCKSFAEFSECFRCNKRWEFSYHTFSCPNKRCGLDKPQVIYPLVNSDACLECEVESRTHITNWLERHKLSPLSWNMTENSWDHVWRAPS